jgi:hypothetical protein
MIFGRWLVAIVIASMLITSAPAALAARDDGTNVTWATPEPTKSASFAAETADQLLPHYRILSYYGFPGNPLMGILGEYDMDELHARLQNQATEYEAADPSRPVKLAFEVIATVAQSDAGPDGLYLAYTGDDIIQQYVDYTAEHDMLLFLDVQFGRSNVKEQINAVSKWLKLPHVQLALDPEFMVKPGEQPGVDLGSIEGKDVTYAQEALVKLAQDAGIPPKILLVHQFNIYMINDKQVIAPMDGVQLVVDADGWGPPSEKLASYDAVVTQEPIQFNGIKLFYRQDDPLMSAADVVALDPSPDVVIYQ